MSSLSILPNYIDHNFVLQKFILKIPWEVVVFNNHKERPEPQTNIMTLVLKRLIYVQKYEQKAPDYMLFVKQMICWKKMKVCHNNKLGKYIKKYMEKCAIK